MPMPNLSLCIDGMTGKLAGGLVGCLLACLLVCLRISVKTAGELLQGSLRRNFGSASETRQVPSSLAANWLGTGVLEV